MKPVETDITHSLVDAHKRRIDYLRISITDRCNLRCLYCIPDKMSGYFKQSELLSTEEIIRFVNIACGYGLKKVRITGGEPLLRKDILSLISGLKQTGVSDLSITTNGIKLACMAEQLKKAGLDRINISLDTLDADRYRYITRGGNIKHIWDAVSEAECSGLYPIKINVVPIKGVNEDEILDFASLTFYKDYHIRFIELMPFGCNETIRQKLFIRTETIMRKISALGRLNRLEFRGKGPSRNYRIEGARGIIGFISPISDCFCEYCNRLRITAQGKIRPCLFSDMEIDIKGPLRSGAPDKYLERLLCKSVDLKPSGIMQNKEANIYTDMVSMSKIGG